MNKRFVFFRLLLLQLVVRRWTRRACNQLAAFQQLPRALSSQTVQHKPCTRHRLFELCSSKSWAIGVAGSCAQCRFSQDSVTKVRSGSALLNVGHRTPTAWMLLPAKSKQNAKCQQPCAFAVVQSHGAGACGSRYSSAVGLLLPQRCHYGGELSLSLLLQQTKARDGKWDLNGRGKGVSSTNTKWYCKIRQSRELLNSKRELELFPSGPGQFVNRLFSAIFCVFSVYPHGGCFTALILFRDENTLTQAHLLLTPTFPLGKVQKP